MPISTQPLRSGTTAEWADTDATDGAASPVLGSGEIGIDKSTGQMGVGDGTTAFPSLALKHRPYKVTNVTLVAGTKLTNDSSVTANTIILPVLKTLGTVTAPKALACTARVVGTSYTVTSSDNTDTSVVQVLLIEP